MKTAGSLALTLSLIFCLSTAPVLSEDGERPLIEPNLAKRFEMELSYVADTELGEEDILTVIKLGPGFGRILMKDVELNRKFVRELENCTPAHKIFLGHSPYLEWAKENGVDKEHWIKIHTRCRLTMTALPVPRGLAVIDERISNAVADLEHQGASEERIEREKKSLDQRYAFQRAWLEMCKRVAPKLSAGEKKLVRKHGIALGRAVMNTVTEADLEPLDPMGGDREGNAEDEGG